MSSTVFYVAFTPSCNKDTDSVLLLGTYDTEADAERNLTRLVRYRQKWIEGLLARSEVSPDDWEGLGGEDTDENPIRRRRAFVFPDLTDAEYETLLGTEFVCLKCAYPPAFWILEADAATYPGEIRVWMRGWLV